MVALNAQAAQAALAAGVGAATDVTGFGLLGHLYKMARASGVTAVVDAAAVPYLDGAREALRDGFVSGGTRRNLDWVRPHLAADVDEDELLLLADAQTSGGLLVVGEVPGAPVIGEIVPRAEGRISGALSRSGCGRLTSYGAHRAPVPSSGAGRGQPRQRGYGAGTAAIVHARSRGAEPMTVPSFQDLPLADRDRAWDGAAAEKRVREWAGAQDEPNARYRDAHVWYDAAEQGQLHGVQAAHRRRRRRLGWSRCRAA